MENKITKKEYEILTNAETELTNTGKTSIKCPRCNSDIVIDEQGSSYTVKCKKTGCVSYTCRGI